MAALATEFTAAMHDTCFGDVDGTLSGDAVPGIRAGRRAGGIDVLPYTRYLLPYTGEKEITNIGWNFPSRDRVHEDCKTCWKYFLK